MQSEGQPQIDRFSRLGRFCSCGIPQNPPQIAQRMRQAPPSRTRYAKHKKVFLKTMKKSIRRGKLIPNIFTTHKSGFELSVEILRVAFRRVQIVEI